MMMEVFAEKTRAAEMSFDMTEAWVGVKDVPLDKCIEYSVGSEELAGKGH